MGFRSKIARLTVLALSGLTILAFFQNCAFPILTSSPSARPFADGGGVNGMRYLTYGPCGSKVDVVNALFVNKNAGEASMIRQNCVDLNAPAAVDFNTLVFARNNDSVFSLQGQVYDAQTTTTASQRVTLEFCQNTSGAQALVWRPVGDSATIFGDVVDGAAATGDLSVLPPSTNPANEYLTVTGQASSFDFTFAGTAGSVTYALNGGAPKTVSNLACSTQSQPPLVDGSSLAPMGAAQRAGLLASYTLHPSWNVAGVDYAVGYPAGTVLKDPATIAFAGVNVDQNAHSITITGDNVTLDSYDFSKNGGWSISVNGAANTRIIRSLFIETASQADAPISTDAGARNLYVGYTVIDGGGAGANPSDGALISMRGQGLIVEYCWLKNAPSNILVFGESTGGGGSILIHYNLVEDAGRKAGGGGVYSSFFSGVYSNIQVVFNTSYQTPGGTGTMGWEVDPAGGARSIEIGNNVMIATASGAASYLTSLQPSGGPALEHDNYFDLTGAFGFAYPGLSGGNNVFTNNFDMTTGQTLPTNP